MTGAPFIVYALPRSRTFWLSQFLSMGGYCCAHEQTRHLRTIEDARSWLSQDWTGAAETTAAHGWRVARLLRPDLRVLVVRRDPTAVLASLEQAGVACGEVVRRRVAILDRRLDQIEREDRDVLSVRFDDLAREEVCGAVFRHCLGAEMPAAWWATMDPLVMECDLAALGRYVDAHWKQLRKFSAAVVVETRAILSLARVERAAQQVGPVEIAEERFAEFWRDGQALFAEHAAMAGPRDDFERSLNVPVFEALDRSRNMQILTARANGELVGYCMAIFAPALDVSNLMQADLRTFFVVRPYRGIGPRLAAEVRERLRAKGVGEVFLREGTMAAGSRLGALWRRWGASDAGRVYRMNLMSLEGSR